MRQNILQLTKLVLPLHKLLLEIRHSIVRRVFRNTKHYRNISTHYTM